MGLPGRCSRWRPTPGPAERPRPDAFVPGRVLVGFEAGAGEQGRRTGAAGGRVVAGRAGPGWSSSTGMPTSGRPPPAGQPAGRGLRRAGLGPPGRRLRPGLEVCWHLQTRPGANVVAPTTATAGAGRTMAVAIPTSSHGTEVASVLAAAAADVFGELTRSGPAAARTSAAPPPAVISRPTPGHLPARRVLHRAGRRLPPDPDGAQRGRPAVRGRRPRVQPQRRRCQGPLHLERSWPRPQPVRAPYRRRRPGHDDVRDDLIGAGPAPGGHLPLRQHRSGPAPSERDPGPGAAGHLVWEDVGESMAAGAFSDVIEAADTAGNTSTSQRHRVRVL
jgi:hypothetical protein